jgi:hypothetical protein
VINQDKKCIQLCGLNVSNIFSVGLLSGLIGAGVAYFILIRSSNFQWWWLVALFGIQFLSIIAVAYALQKTLSLNNMFCETLVLVSSCDWSNLRAARVSAPRLIPSDCSVSTNESADINSADWQDLLRQLDQMSQVTPTSAQQVTHTLVSDVICPPATTISTPPTAQPAAPSFDFSAMASALATPTPAATSMTSPVSTPTSITPSSTKTTAPATPVTQPAPQTTQPQTQPSQGIDFASLFR